MTWFRGYQGGWFCVPSVLCETESRFQPFEGRELPLSPRTGPGIERRRPVARPLGSAATKKNVSSPVTGRRHAAVPFSPGDESAQCVLATGLTRPHWADSSLERKTS
jgi:hypothetical protein